MTFQCCRGCVAPKRYPGCHDHCPEYIEGRAEYDRIKEIRDRERNIRNAIYRSRSEKVYKAMREIEKWKKAKGI